MKYLKRYEKFITENVKFVNKNIDNSLLIVEKQVLRDFSSSFWTMSLNSCVFTKEEKQFIKENLITIKVDLVSEGWLSDTLSGVWDKAKEVGGKLYDKVQSKIKIIKDNIKNLLSGISDFLKNMFKSIGESFTVKSASQKQKVKSEFAQKTKAILEKSKPKDEDLANEFKQIKITYDHITKSIKVGLFVKNVDTSDDSVMKDAENQVVDLENELKAESANNDILKAFYITEAEENKVEYKVKDRVKYKRKDGTEAEGEIIKIEDDNIFFKDKEGKEFSKKVSDIIEKVEGLVQKTWSGFAKWCLDMEQSTPPEKDKAVWWIQLILKVVTLILSPIVKALEIAAKFVASNVLKASSQACKFLGGPGVFEFLVLGGIVAGIPALVTEFSLVSHKMPEPYAKIFEIVSHFLAEAAGFKALITIFGAICTTMTLAQLVVEFKHLFGSHGEEKEVKTA